MLQTHGAMPVGYCALSGLAGGGNGVPGLCEAAGGVEEGEFGGGVSWPCSHVGRKSVAPSAEWEKRSAFRRMFSAACSSTHPIPPHPMPYHLPPNHADKSLPPQSDETKNMANRPLVEPTHV